MPSFSVTAAASFLPFNLGRFWGKLSLRIKKGAIRHGIAPWEAR